MNVQCVVACYSSVERRPTFVPVTLDLTWEQAWQNGEHYEKAREAVREMGYDDPGHVYDQGDEMFWVFRHFFQETNLACQS